MWAGGGQGGGPADQEQKKKKKKEKFAFKNSTGRGAGKGGNFKESRWDNHKKVQHLYLEEVRSSLVFRERGLKKKKVRAIKGGKGARNDSWFPEQRA